MCWQRGSWWKGSLLMGWLISAPLPRAVLVPRHTWDGQNEQQWGIKRDGGSTFLPGHCPVPPSPSDRVEGSLGTSLCVPGEHSQAQPCKAQGKNHPKQAANYSPLLRVEELWIVRALIQRLLRSLPRIQDIFQKEKKISVSYFTCHLPHPVKSLTL